MTIAEQFREQCEAVMKTGDFSPLGQFGQFVKQNRMNISPLVDGYSVVEFADGSSVRLHVVDKEKK